MVKALISVICALLAVAVVAYGYIRIQKKMVICSQSYALCTSAQCIPDPEDPGRSVCFCSVQEEGESLGHYSCSDRRPRIDKFGLKHITSTFSLVNFSVNASMTCDAGPWSDCMDKPCIIDPLDPSKAFCICKIMPKGTFATFGGNCDKSTCKDGYWSGATLPSAEFNLNAMMESQNLTSSPKRTCPK